MTVNGETMTLFDHINQTHVGAVQEVKQLAKDWLSLYGMVDSERLVDLMTDSCSPDSDHNCKVNPSPNPNPNPKCKVPWCGGTVRTASE